MRNHALPSLLGLVLASCLHLSTADAQATRTWVSGVGDDANPCSRTAPCKTFPGAISKTAAGGEINCLDPGGFGGVTITKSITIDCTGTFASILASGTNGVIVNGAGILVTLRGLSINGVGTGLIGIRFLQGTALHVDNVSVSGFRAGLAVGLHFQPSNPGAELNVIRSSFTENGTTTDGSAVLIQPSSTGSAIASLSHVRMVNNFRNLNANGTGTTGPVNVAIDKSVSSNSTSGVGAVAGTSPNVTIVVSDSLISNNSSGVSATGANAKVIVSNNLISGNGSAYNTATGGQVITFTNNALAANGADGVATGTLTPK